MEVKQLIMQLVKEVHRLYTMAEAEVANRHLIHKTDEKTEEKPVALLVIAKMEDLLHPLRTHVAADRQEVHLDSDAIFSVGTNVTVDTFE